MEYISKYTGEQIDSKLDKIGAEKLITESDIVNNITVGGEDKVLSAEQGLVLKNIVDSTNANINTAITDINNTITNNENAQVIINKELRDKIDNIKPCVYTAFNFKDNKLFVSETSLNNLYLAFGVETIEEVAEILNSFIVGTYNVFTFATSTAENSFASNYKIDYIRLSKQGSIYNLMFSVYESISKVSIYKEMAIDTLNESVVEITNRTGTVLISDNCIDNLEGTDPKLPLSSTQGSVIKQMIDNISTPPNSKHLILKSTMFDVSPLTFNINDVYDSFNVNNYTELEKVWKDVKNGEYDLLLVRSSTGNNTINNLIYYSDFEYSDTILYFRCDIHDKLSSNINYKSFQIRKNETASLSVSPIVQLSTMDIVDNLNSTDVKKVLSAKQGYILDNRLKTVENSIFVFESNRMFKTSPSSITNSDIFTSFNVTTFDELLILFYNAINRKYKLFVLNGELDDNQATAFQVVYITKFKVVEEILNFECEVHTANTKIIRNYSYVISRSSAPKMAMYDINLLDATNIINNLTTNSSNVCLSANQGLVLKGMIDDLLLRVTALENK